MNITSNASPNIVLIYYNRYRQLIGTHVKFQGQQLRL